MRARTLRMVALGCLLPGGALAQVGNPLPQSTAMGDNYTALARGFAAPAWNPAGLGLPDNPSVSFSAFPVRFSAGLSPITAGDLARYDGRLIPRAARIDWLEAIEREGGQKGRVAADVTYLAISIGTFAFSASTSVRGRVDMAPDVAEIFFFGNAGRTGAPGDYDLEGSTVDAAGTSTLAVSAALPVPLSLGPLPDQHLAVGATLTYTVGNVLVLGQEVESSLRSDPLSVDVRFPLVHTEFPDESIGRSLGDVIDNGAGVGLDLGVAWQGGTLAAGVVVKNLFHTFDWDLDALRYRDGSAVWTGDTASTSFEERDIANAPPALLDRIDELYTFSPVLTAGAAARVLPELTVSGDIRHALRDNLDLGARSHVGVGAELEALPMVPVRAGLAWISGGYRVTGGVGVRAGPFQLAAACAVRKTRLGSDAGGSFGVTFGVR
jgi:hypothetical protein